MANLAELLVKVGVDADDLTGGIETAVGAVEENLGKIGLAGAAAGGLMEGFARGQGDATAALGRTSAATGETEGSLRDLAVELSDHTFAASDAAEGMELLTQKGIGTREEFEQILPTVDQLADATGLGLTESIEAADKMLAPFGEDLNDAGENSDQMARLIAQTDVPLGTLERNLGRVPEELQGLGFGLDDAAAGIEHFRDQGYTGQEAVREFRRAVGDSDGDMTEFLDTLGMSAEEWEKYGAAVEPQAGLAEELAEANNSVMTPMEQMQAHVENLMFKYGGLAEAAGLLAMPLMALGPILKGVMVASTLLATGLRGLVTGVASATTAIFAKIAALTAWAARMAATAARVVAGWVLMGAQAMLQGARMAAAWVLAMGPIGWITAAVVALVALVIANWDTVKEWTVTAWEAVSSAISGAWDSIISWVTGAIDSVVSFLQRGWSTVQSATSAAFNAVVSFIASIPGRIMAGLAALGQLGAKFAGWVNDARQGAVDRFNDLVSFVADIPGNILSTLGDLGSLLFDGGKNIIQGMIDGITSMVGNIGSAVSGAVDTVRDFLPWSPAKRGPLRENPPELGGKNIAEMIAGGISDGEDDVIAEAERIAAAAAVDMPDVSGPRIPGAGRIGSARGEAEAEGSNGLTVNIDMRGARMESDEQVKKLSQEIWKRSNNQARSRGAVNLQGVVA